MSLCVQVDEALGHEGSAKLDRLLDENERSRAVCHSRGSRPSAGQSMMPVGSDGMLPSEARSSVNSEPGHRADAFHTCFSSWSKYAIERQDRRSVLHFCEAKYRLGIIRRALHAFLDFTSNPSGQNASSQTSPRDVLVGEPIKRTLNGVHSVVASSVEDSTCTKDAANRYIRSADNFPADKGTCQEIATTTSRPQCGGHAKNEYETAESADGFAYRPRFRQPRLPPVPPIRGKPVVKDDMMLTASSGRGQGDSGSLRSKTRVGFRKARLVGIAWAGSTSSRRAQQAGECVREKTGPGDDRRKSGMRVDRRQQREKLLHKVEALESKLLREISDLDAQVYESFACIVGAYSCVYICSSSV